MNSSPFIEDSKLITDYLDHPDRFLTPEEWIEMENLKRELDFGIVNLTTKELERFSELYSKSIHGKGNNTHLIHSYNKLETLKN